MAICMSVGYFYFNIPEGIEADSIFLKDSKQISSGILK
jgi:hypothetical protein